MRAPLPRAGVRSISADVCPDPLDGSANRDDSRHATPHSALRKNRHSRALVFSPSKWAGKKFQSCERRRKRFPQSSDRDSPMRDTSFRMEEEVLVFSYAFDSERVATARHAARMHKRSLGILQQLFNNRFGLVRPVHHFCVDHIELRIVSSHDASLAKVGGEFPCRRIAIAWFGVNEHRAALGIRMTRWNRRVWKNNYGFPRPCESQTMAAGKTGRRTG